MCGEFRPSAVSFDVGADEHTGELEYYGPWFWPVAQAKLASAEVPVTVSIWSGFHSISHRVSTVHSGPLCALAARQCDMTWVGHTSSA